MNPSQGRSVTLSSILLLASLLSACADSGNDTSPRPEITTIVTRDSQAAVAGEQELATLTCVADVSGSLRGKYWLFSTPDTDYYIWYSVGGTGTDPQVGGRTGITVYLNSNDDATQVASSTATVINTEQISGAIDFTVANSTNTLTVTADDEGVATDVGVGTSGFTAVSVTTQGTDPIAALGGTYFAIYSTTGDYYVWINTGGSTDPAIAGLTGIEISGISVPDTAADIAAAIKSALDLTYSGEFTTIVSASTVTVTGVSNGNVTDAADHDTGFTISVTQQGAD